MEITVKTNNREIICSGSAIIAHGDYLEFIIKTLRFRLSFDYHNEERRSFFQPVVNTEDPSNTFLEIRAYNFDNVTLSALTHPIVLAQQEGRNLSLSLVVSTINRRNDPANEGTWIEDKIVSYTWYYDLPQVNQG